MMKELQLAIEKVVRRIAGILNTCSPSIYLYGSCVLNDFKPGWSDIDILVLTEKQMSEAQAQQLVRMRQTMLVQEPNNLYYRSFEGGILTAEAFISGASDRVVYWGTSGERVADGYDFDACCMAELLDNGILLYGNDVRSKLVRPSFEQLRASVQRHYEAIRKYVQKTDRSFYSFGWFLDISRCIYTLRTGKIISKTAAGEWALEQKLCPCASALEKAIEVRKTPKKYKDDKSVFDYAETLGDYVQRYADVLERELKRTGKGIPGD